MSDKHPVHKPPPVPGTLTPGLREVPRYIWLTELGWWHVAWRRKSTRRERLVVLVSLLTPIPVAVLSAVYFWPACLLLIAPFVAQAYRFRHIRTYMTVPK